MYQLRAFWKHFSKCNAPIHRIFLRHASFLMLHKNKTIMTQLLCIFQVPKLSPAFACSPACTAPCWWALLPGLAGAAALFFESCGSFESFFIFLWRFSGKSQLGGDLRPLIKVDLGITQDRPRWNWKMLLGKRTSGRNTCLVSCQQAQTLKAEGKKKKDGGISWHISHSWNCDRHMTGTRIACGVLTPGNLLLHCTASHNL